MDNKAKISISDATEILDKAVQSGLIGENAARNLNVAFRMKVNQNEAMEKNEVKRFMHDLFSKEG